MTVHSNKLRLLTWNLWFDDYLQIERLLSVLSYIEPLAPDIVAFQEMTDIADRFFGDPSIPFSRSYNRVPATVPHWQWYWEGVYSRFPIGENSQRREYRHSDMARGVTLLHNPGLDLVVGCTHLESEHEYALRRDQFSQAVEHIESFGASNNILLGDTNLRAGEKLDDLLPRGWADVWAILKPDDPGFTVNSDINPMGHGNRKERLDRVYYSCRDFEPADIKLVGTGPEKTETGRLFCPSDHFGLLVDFSPIRVNN
jgi:endonuclease/exonuclease/phosphatase (EEP) superfamily protein YafD